MILSSRGGNVAVRDVTLGMLIENYGGGLRSSSSTAVTPRTVGGLPAAKEAIRIAAEAVGKRELAVFRGRGVERKPVRTTPSARLFDGLPNDDGDSWYQVLEGLEASLTSRNNGFWLKERGTDNRVSAVRLLHPDDVEGRWNKERRRVEYRYRLEDVGWSDWVGRDVILHFRVGHVSPGACFSPTPVQLHRETLRAALAKVGFEGDMYENGVLEGLVVTFPKEVGKEEADEWREGFQAEHGGVANRSKVRVLGGGATMETIGLSMEDAQFVESVQMSVHELARVFGVHASLIGAGAALAQGSAPVTPEHEEMRWNSYGLEPRLARIAGAINADPDFFGRGSKDYVLFSEVRARADTATESEALVREVQAGIRVPDEARAVHGLPPLPDGLGQIPQITPTGAKPNPNLPEQVGAVEPDDSQEE